VLVAVSWTYPNGADDALAHHSVVGRLHLLIAFVNLLPGLITGMALVHLPDMLMIHVFTATFMTGLT